MGGKLHMLRRVLIGLGLVLLAFQFGCATGKWAKEDPWQQYPPEGAYKGADQHADGYWWIPSKIGPQAGALEGPGNRGVLFYAGAEKAAPPPDSDGDGGIDSLDKCPGTPKGVKVDAVGCPLDSDGDGVPDYLDKCPGTPKGVKVDEVGCPLDTDGDGVPDYKDKCPDTPKGVKVDEVGCPLDADGDGVPDYLDKCPGTPKGAPVNAVGCWIIKGLLFDYDKWDIKAQYHDELNVAVKVLDMNPSMKVQIQGHTDSMGSDAYNQTLSEKRAGAVRDYMVSKGISADRLTVKGFGESKPVATNDTAEGRAQNRRVQLDILGM